MDDRKKKILQAVIDEYINTAEPVSSGALVKKYGLDYSSATVRNELAELENNGYLDKTHTSSGRVPSEKGYRFYVDELMKEDNISLEEIKYIQNKLSTKINEIEITTSTLSEITHYTTIAIGPRPETQIIEEIKFVLLGTRMLMVVIITDNGLVKETIIKYEKDITESQVETLNNLFNSKLKGKPLSKIDKPMEEYILSEINYSIDVIKPIIEQINKVIEKEEEVYYQGTGKSFELPEFKSLDIAKNFVNVLDTKELMLEMLNSGVAKDINVYIGDENEQKELKDFSVVTFKHTVGNKELGTIGIIGPKRMNYSKVISVMKYISQKLNNNLQINNLEEENKPKEEKGGIKWQKKRKN